MLTGTGEIVTHPRTRKPNNNYPFFNSRIVDTYIKLIKKKYPHVNLDKLLRYAGMEPYEVADQGHWFSQNQIDRFHKRLAQLTNNESIAREAGRYGASPDAIGLIRPYVLGMVDPARAYAMIGRAARKFTRSAEYESRKLAPNRVEITVTPVAGSEEKYYQCQNRIGYFESITLAFTNKLPRIEHTECMFEGGHQCRYVISWDQTQSAVWKKARFFSALVSISAMLVALVANPFVALTILLPASVSVILILSLWVEVIEKKELKTSVNHLLNSTEKLLDQININYNNSQMTNEIGLAISKQRNISAVLSRVSRILENRTDFDRGMILLANKSKTRLEVREFFGYKGELNKAIKRMTFSLDRPDSRGAFVVAYRKKKPFLIDDINDIEDFLSPRSKEFAHALHTESFLCCPIVADDESIGVLAVDNLRSKRKLVQSDLSLLTGIAAVLGVSVRNTELIEARERQFRSIIQVLAASIDARDPFTSGHSEKVTEYSMGICEEMGLEKDYTEMIRVAALLHDYGKLAVPDAILKKPGRLTPIEYNTVKKHAIKTREILDQITFEGIFKEVPKVAGSHHEKIDGSGYPLGLSENQIPLGAKIIAVADFFEAITSQRHYRDPMSATEAFRRLKGKSGTHFDKEIVGALFRYYTKKHPLLKYRKVS